MRRAGIAVIAFVIAITPALAASAQSEITLEDIAAAEQSRRAIGVELTEATALYDSSVARLIELENSLTSLGIELSKSEQELAGARVAAKEIAVDRYMFAGGGSSALFDSVTIHDARIRTGYLEILSRVGTDTVIKLFALEESYEAQQTIVEQALASQISTKAELEELAGMILTRLDEANREYDAVVAAYEVQEEERRIREEEERLRLAEEARLREEEEQRRRDATSTTTTVAVTTTTSAPESSTTSSTAAPSTTTTTTTTTTVPPSTSLVCPVNGAVAFTDTWGAPRSGGRTHQGVDMIAARGTPLVAIEAGTVKRMSNGGLGGITVTLAGASGDEFYYAHLDGWADGLSVGQALDVGELLGYVGNTGNAQYTIPHLHFEYHPNGGAAVNPYPLVAGLCL